MLGKWFKRKSAPTNDGDSGSEDGTGGSVKVFELVLSNMEESPSYALTHQLSVGSEIGNIIIADPSISPRHATFVLQQEVVAVTDHGSVNGTFVNGKKIEPGKQIILEETDVVLVGDLEIKLKVERAAKPQKIAPKILAAPKAEEKSKSKPSGILGQKKGKQKSKKFSFSMSTPDPSANALVRVIAVVADLLLSYVLVVILTPFDDFRSFLESVPALLEDLTGVTLKDLWGSVLDDYPFAQELLTEGHELLSTSLEVGSIFLVFILLRLLTTLIFGASFSEAFLGMRASGNRIWARIGGMLRVLIGILSWPFIIFDLPSIISKRTLKEFITFTNLTIPSKFIAILGIIFYVPLLFALCLAAPLLQGLEPPEPMAINDRVDQRIRVKVAAPAEGEAPTVPPVTDASALFNLELKYPTKDLLLIPAFRFHGGKNKLIIKSGVIFYQRDLQREVKLEVLKNFDMKQLLGLGIKGNFFLYEHYPEIYNFVYALDEANPAFKKNLDAKAQAKFATEVISFSKSAFSLSLENVLEVMQDETPLIKGFMDYRSALLGLLEYQDFNSIGFAKIGNVIFMKVAYQKQKPFDLLIPLIKGDGRVFKVTYDKRDKLSEVSNKFYKFNLSDTDWLPGQRGPETEVLTALGVLDVFANEGQKTFSLTATRAQAIYAYVFETSSAVLRGSVDAELTLWKEEVKGLLKLIETLPASKVPEGETDPREKLLQNLRDLVNALEQKNVEYFGAVTSV